MIIVVVAATSIIITWIIDRRVLDAQTLQLHRPVAVTTLNDRLVSQVKAADESDAKSTDFCKISHLRVPVKVTESVEVLVAQFSVLKVPESSSLMIENEGDGFAVCVVAVLKEFLGHGVDRIVFESFH